MDNIALETKATRRSPRLGWFLGLLSATLTIAVLIGAASAAAQGPAYDLTKVKNKSFEKDTNGDGIPNGWYRSGAVVGMRVCNQSYAGACSYRFGGGGDSYLNQQTLYSSGPAGIVATLTAWTKGKDVNIGTYAYVLLLFNHSDGSSNFCPFYIPGGTTPWTMRSTPCTADEAFDSMTIVLNTNLNSGKIWVDKVSLTAEAP